MVVFKNVDLKSAWSIQYVQMVNVFTLMDLPKIVMLVNVEQLYALAQVVIIVLNH